MSLPMIFTRSSHIPASVPYLTAGESTPETLEDAHPAEAFQVLFGLQIDNKAMYRSKAFLWSS